MPIEVALWKLGDHLDPVEFIRMDSESRLEAVLAKDISVIDPGLLVIGRQVVTAFGKYIDLLALDAEGQVVVIELKRDRTPREVVAQLLDYGSWVRSLDADDLDRIFVTYGEKYAPEHQGSSLATAFCAKFGLDEVPLLNEHHRLLLVAAELDESSERIIRYLAEAHGVSINAAFFRAFRDGKSEFLSRAWLADPKTVEQKVEAKREKVPWNGEFYVSFGGDQKRVWEEARQHGFISAGGSVWYTRTLGLLEPGDRIWVNLPKYGYAGVGRVTEKVVPVDEFTVDDGKGKRVPIRSLPLKAAGHPPSSDAKERAEHFVRVEWIKTVPVDKAYKEVGFFGNQNTVARPRAQRWVHTVEKLKKHFGVRDEE